MDDQTETFLISAKYLTAGRRFQFVMIAAYMAILFRPAAPSVDGIPPLSFVQYLLVMAVVNEFTYMLGQWSKTKLHLGPDGIVRETGTVREVVLWERITRLRICENLRGEVRTVEICVADRRPLRLYGFESLARVAEKIQSRVPPTAPVIAQRRAVDWQNPLLLVAFVVLTLLVAEMVRRLGNAGLYHAINSAIFGGLGVWCLVGRSLSRYNAKYRKWEILLGVLVLVVSIGSLLGLVPLHRSPP